MRSAGIKLQDFDIYEIHEAFEAQVLCTLKAWESPEFCRDRLGLSEPLCSIGRLARAAERMAGYFIGLSAGVCF